MAATVPQLRKDPEAPPIAPRLNEHQLNVDDPTVPFLSRDDPADVILTPSDVVSSPPDVILSLPNDEEPVAFSSQAPPGDDLPSHEEASQGDIAVSPSDDLLSPALPSFHPEAFPLSFRIALRPYSLMFRHPSLHLSPQIRRARSTRSPPFFRGLLRALDLPPRPRKFPLSLRSARLSPALPERLRRMERRGGKPVIGRCTTAGMGEDGEREEREDGTRENCEERREEGREKGTAAVVRGGEGGGEVAESEGWCATSSTSSVLVGGEEECCEGEECEGHAEAEEMRERDSKGRVEGKSEDGEYGREGSAEEEGQREANAAVAAVQAGRLMGPHGVASQGPEGEGAVTTVQAGRVAGTDGVVASTGAWVPPVSPFGLIQERLYPPPTPPTPLVIWDLFRLIPSHNSLLVPQHLLSSFRPLPYLVLPAPVLQPHCSSFKSPETSSASSPFTSSFETPQPTLFPFFPGPYTSSASSPHQRQPSQHRRLRLPAFPFSPLSPLQLHKVDLDLFRLIPTPEAAIAASTAEIACISLLPPLPLQLQNKVIWDLFRLIPTPEAAIAASTAEIACISFSPPLPSAAP
ncbi:unnamed protein product [Closterium sp. NIES-64]|nr:unnamed protein product [Closterium sp. NIES-64]